MIKYAKLINKDTGLCEVGLGTNNEFYESIGMKELDVLQSDIDNKWYLIEKCIMKTNEQKELEEKEYVQELFMTRSDFFDGTIQAWGIGEDELLVLITNLLSDLLIDNTKRLMAINNFKNALNFYRKHDLFKILIDVPIQLNNDVQIIIKEQHLDDFFNQINKGNKNIAWKYLPKPIMQTQD